MTISINTRYSKFLKDLGESNSNYEEELEDFEIKTLNYLVYYFQSGSLTFLKEIFKISEFQISNITGNTLNELIELSFIKMLAFKSSIFKNSLKKWAQKITINSINNLIILNNQIEGKILWKETFRERNYLRYPRSLKFVCMSYKNNFDSLENTLIKSFLVYLKNLFEGYQKSLKIPYKEVISIKDVNWKQKIRDIKQTLDLILRNYYMREITYKKNEWNNYNQLNRALKNCHKNNRFILVSAKLLNDLISKRDKNLLKYFFANYIIKPNQDKIAELFVLFSIINAISSISIDGGQQFLIKSNSNQDYIFEKELNEGTVRVYYQKKPTWASIKYSDDSSFTQAIKNYDLSNVELRPDITIEIELNGKKKLIMIEVKNSSRKAYLRDGLQQICNYYDLLTIEENSEPKKLKNSTSSQLEGYLVVKSIPDSWKKNIVSVKNDFNIKIMEFKDFDSLDKVKFAFDLSI